MLKQGIASLVVLLCAESGYGLSRATLRRSSSRSSRPAPSAGSSLEAFLYSRSAAAHDCFVWWRPSPRPAAAGCCASRRSARYRTSAAFVRSARRHWRCWRWAGSSHGRPGAPCINIRNSQSVWRSRPFSTVDRSRALAVRVLSRASAGSVRSHLVLSSYGSRGPCLAPVPVCRVRRGCVRSRVAVSG